MKNLKLWQKIVRQALEEDKVEQDITSQLLIPANQKVRAKIIARQAGIFCGQEIIKMIFKQNRFKTKIYAKDSQTIKKNALIARLYGPARKILAYERTLLNFIQHLSGIATLTKEYVHAVQPYPVKIYDTRKTTPGLRNLEKYAVRCGGGYNHRSNLSEMVLIKDNHLSLLKNTKQNVVAQFIGLKKIPIEIEAESIAQVKQFLTLGVNIIMLDNFKLPQLKDAIQLIKKFRGKNKYPQIEVSGGITLDNIQTIAQFRPDRISVGAITHSAPALDISLEVIVGNII